MVRSSASAATAAMGNLTAAKQLAMSAQAMEDAYESSRERSSARRALIYCLLRGDNHSAALSLLQSMRSK
jgi:pentatricopeptide repeat protein